MPTIKGLDKLNEQLKSISGLSTDPKALEAGAYELMRGSMIESPVKTGFLRQSHSVEPTEDGVEMVVGADYALAVEMGTEKMAPRGFVRRAISKYTTNILEAIKNYIERGFTSLWVLKLN